MNRWAARAGGIVVMLVVGVATASVAAAHPVSQEGGDGRGLAGLHEQVGRMHETMAVLEEAVSQEAPNAARIREQMVAMGNAVAEVHGRMTQVHYSMARSATGKNAQDVASMQQEVTSMYEEMTAVQKSLAERRDPAALGSGNSVTIGNGNGSSNGNSNVFGNTDDGRQGHR
jgi:hypothetical protein